MKNVKVCHLSVLVKFESDLCNFQIHNRYLEALGQILQKELQVLCIDASMNEAHHNFAREWAHAENTVNLSGQ